MARSLTHKTICRNPDETRGGEELEGTSMLPQDENPKETPANDLVSQIEGVLQVLDGMFASTVLSIASMMPGPAGISAAVAAAAFDVAHRYWVGALLSGLSMIPLVGYFPGALKIAWNVRLISKGLGKIETMLPEVEQQPQLLARIQEIVGKYSGKLLKVRIAARLSAKVERIMSAKARPIQTLTS